MMKVTVVFLSVMLAIAGLPLGFVNVEGAVTKPGAVAHRDGLRLRQAIDVAGGLAKDADGKAVELIRANGEKMVVDVTKLGPTPVLGEGDRIVIPKFDKSRYVTVGGAVETPGAINYQSGLKLGDAVKNAKPYKDANLDSITISRTENGKTKSFKVNLKDINAVVLQPGDAVNVAYPGQGFSNNELLTILLIVVIVVLIAK
jgi:protein involved in polysaccharide export with SLBB domain